MPRAEVGTPKWVANKMKSKGLQRLRWYCQVCEKQCRDENGFKCHAQSEAHLRQMLVVGENAGRHINNYSMEFQSAFVKLLSRRFGTKRVFANTVYQEYISDKNHMHMNATRWVTLTEFVKYLGRAGIARVDETEKGLFLAWIDNSPKALAKAEASMKKDRSTISDEQRERQLIAEQIERANADAGQSTPSGSSHEAAISEGLKRDEGAEKIVLSLSTKPAAANVDPSAPPAGPSSLAGGVRLNPLKPATNPLKANPLKRLNPLKGSTATATHSSSSSMPAPVEPQPAEKKRPLTVAEQLIIEDQQRKRRRMEREGQM